RENRLSLKEWRSFAMPDPMTGLEILDDAVKIGLGAVIGLVGAKLSHVREWQTERSNRRIATLEKITEDFEKAHQGRIAVARSVDNDDDARWLAERLHRSFGSSVDVNTRFLGLLLLVIGARRVEL